MIRDSLNFVKQQLVYLGFSASTGNNIDQQVYQNEVEGLTVPDQCIVPWNDGSLQPVNFYIGVSLNRSTNRFFHEGVGTTFFPPIYIEKSSVQFLAKEYPGLMDELSAGKYREEGLTAGASHQLMELMQRRSDVFNILSLNYRPQLPFEIPEVLQIWQQRVQEKLTISQYFQASDQLTALQMAGLMLGNPVYRSKRTQRGKLIGGWVKLDFSAPLTQDGRFPIKPCDGPGESMMDQLLTGYSFQECSTPEGRLQIATGLRNGQFIPVHFASGTGSPIYASLRLPGNSLHLTAAVGYNDNNAVTLITQDTHPISRNYPPSRAPVQSPSHNQKRKI